MNTVLNYEQIETKFNYTTYTHTTSCQKYNNISKFMKV